MKKRAPPASKTASSCCKKASPDFSKLIFQN
jgi:hypothetical protein